MTKYNVFDLWVIKAKEYYFICEKEYNNSYREIFTKEKIKAVETCDILPLYDYYYPFVYENNKPLMLSEKALLIKYAYINSPYIEKEKEKLKYNYKERIKETEDNDVINDKSLVRVLKKD